MSFSNVPKRPVIIVTAHGSGGNSLGGTKKKWLNESHEKYIDNVDLDTFHVSFDEFSKSLLYKSTMDTMINMYERGYIKDFINIITQGKPGRKTEKYITEMINHYHEFFIKMYGGQIRPFIILVGKSFGGNDCIKYINDYTDHKVHLLCTIDPKGFPLLSKTYDINMDNVERVVNYYQRRRAFRGREVVAIDSKDSYRISNFLIDNKTRFPNKFKIFPGEKIDHFNIDEYVTEVGVMGSTVSDVIESNYFALA